MAYTIIVTHTHFQSSLVPLSRSHVCPDICPANVCILRRCLFFHLNIVRVRPLRLERSMYTIRYVAECSVCVCSDGSNSGSFRIDLARHEGDQNSSMEICLVPIIANILLCNSRGGPVYLFFTGRLYLVSDETTS